MNRLARGCHAWHEQAAPPGPAPTLLLGPEGLAVPHPGTASGPVLALPSLTAPLYDCGKMTAANHHVARLLPVPELAGLRVASRDDRVDAGGRQPPRRRVLLVLDHPRRPAVWRLGVFLRAQDQGF